MAYDQEFLDWLNTPNSYAQPEQAPVGEQENSFLKFGKQVANLPGATASKVSQSIWGLLGGDEALPGSIEAAGEIIPKLDTGKPQGVKDFIMEQAIPEIASWMVPYTAVGKVGKAAAGIERTIEVGGKLKKITELPRAAAILTEGIGQGVATGFSEAKYPDVNAQAGTGLGFLSGVLQQALPRWQRVLPLAAVSAIEGARNDSATVGALNFAFNMLPGAAKGLKPSTIKSTSPFVASPHDASISTVEVNPKKAGTGNYEATNYPGEFEFLDNLQVKLPKEELVPDLFRLKEGGFQQELPLQNRFEPSGLQKEDHLSRLQKGEVVEPKPEGNISDAGFFLEDSRPRVQQPLSPLLELQAQRQAPRMEAFPFLEETPVRSPKDVQTESLFSQTKPQPQVQTEFPKPRSHYENLAKEVGDVKYDNPHPNEPVQQFTTKDGDTFTLPTQGLTKEALQSKVAEKTNIRGKTREIQNVPGAEDAFYKHLESGGDPVQWNKDFQSGKLFPEPAKPNDVVGQILQAKNTQDAHSFGKRYIKTPEEAEQVLTEYKNRQSKDREAISTATPENISAIAEEANKTQLLHEAYQEATGNRIHPETGKIVSAKEDILKRNPSWAPSIQSKLKPLQGGESGKVSKEALAVLGATGVAGAVAYHESKGDIGATLAASVLTAGLGVAGINALKKFKAKVGPEVQIGTGVKLPLKDKLDVLARDTAHTPAGLAVGGRGGLWANSVHKAEGLLGFNGLEEFKQAKIHANGFVADQVEGVLNAYNDVRKSFDDLSSSFVDAEGKYLRGQLADETVVRSLLHSGSSIQAGDAWNGLSKTEKAKYPEKWMVLDDPNSTNTKGTGVEVWHVTEDVKQRLMQAQRDALDKMATSPTEKEWSKFSIKYRDTADNLLQMFHDGLPEGSAEQARLTGTIGQYMTRSHAIISDPKAYPNEMEIQNAMSRLGALKEDAYINKFASKNPTATKGTMVSWKGSTYYMHPTDAADFQFLHSPESLRSEVRDYIKELKDISSLKKLGTIPQDSEQFMSSLFTGRKELDEVTQALLGTHQAPLEMMQHTLNKLVPAAQVSHFMQDAVQMVNPKSGLKVSFNEIDFNKKIAEVKNNIATARTPIELDKAKFQLQELESYSRMDQQSNFGLAKDTFVDRELKRQIASFDGSPFGFLDNAIGKALVNFNSFFKTGHLVLSPASIARQFVQAPMMMAMGNVRDPNMIKTAWQGYKDRSSGFGKWMNQWGVFSSSAVHGEFNHTLEDVLSGAADKTILDKLKSGVKHAQKLFALPDDVVRASVFMNEAKRVSERLGVSLDSMDDRVAKEAIAFMRRRSMDYSNLPDYVQIGKNIPFVNLFLSYTHEIMRISKNMAIDAAHGDLQAGATLAGISTLPFLAQKMAEGSLSPVDREAWEQAKNTSQDYSRPRFKLPMSRNKDGTFNYLDITSVLPFNDFQMSARAALNGDGASFLQVNPFVGLDKSPFFTMVAPQITGKDQYTDREFRGMGDRIGNLAQQLLPTLTPGVGWEWNKSMPEALGGNLGVTNLKTGRTNTSIGAFLRNFTGVDLTQVNPGISVKNTILAAQSDIADARKYYMDVVKTQGKSPESLERAKQVFVEAVQQIVANLQSKISLTKSNA